MATPKAIPERGTGGVVSKVNGGVDTPEIWAAVQRGKNRSIAMTVSGRNRLFIGKGIGISKTEKSETWGSPLFDVSDATHAHADCTGAATHKGIIILNDHAPGLSASDRRTPNAGLVAHQADRPTVAAAAAAKRPLQC